MKALDFTTGAAARFSASDCWAAFERRPKKNLQKSQNSSCINVTRGYIERMTTNQSNAATTKTFLASTDAKTRNEILANIASHYGITSAEAFAEVTDEEAEHLLDYVTGPIRTATSLLMKRHGLAA